MCVFYFVHRETMWSNGRLLWHKIALHVQHTEKNFWSNTYRVSGVDHTKIINLRPSGESVKKPIWFSSLVRPPSFFKHIITSLMIFINHVNIVLICFKTCVRQSEYIWYIFMLIIFSVAILGTHNLDRLYLYQRYITLCHLISISDICDLSHVSDHKYSKESASSAILFQTFSISFIIH